ncbi:hypothetical protein B0H16DRAFT_1484236 [Mycena metata]|uniref:Uncharacterized protein n=1 Tax=Mycena metata TaxID=1033252 RepID=A0AAD7DUE2_9AGAR|nr:hypothetical protein B0H16DRAFT_1484236 [Mycena metata]
MAETFYRLTSCPISFLSFVFCLCTYFYTVYNPDYSEDADTPQLKKKKGSNQHLPTLLSDLLKPYIVHYWLILLTSVLTNFDIKKYGWKCINSYKELGLKGIC